MSLADLASGQRFVTLLIYDELITAGHCLAFAEHAFYFFIKKVMQIAKVCLLETSPARLEHSISPNGGHIYLKQFFIDYGIGNRTEIQDVVYGWPKQSSNFS